MPKQKTKYVCSNCGYETLKWMGKCPQCDEWNTLTEEAVETGKPKRGLSSNDIKPIPLSENIEREIPRLSTNINELDRVLGGGLMPGSVILIGGDPGIGKSTLVMQASASIKNKVLYVSGEESVNQINLRAKRLKLKSESLLLYAETNLDSIESAIEKTEPDVVIIDSIQTCYIPQLENAPGTVTQIRECTTQIMQLAKKKGFSAILIGHVTKEGFIAGPKVLEHVVDTVLQFEGEKNHTYRILRAQKNRFGSTNEIGIFEMHDDGLHEVKNPSSLFLSEREGDVTGSIVTASMEGTRPVLLEVQALVTPSQYGNPQRVTTGFDGRRLSILLAVLEKRANIILSNQNVFLNIAGGIKIDEPAVDLAICASIASSMMDRPANEGVIAIGEVGLGGEIRSVSNIEKRIQEAEKLGFKAAVVPSNNSKALKGTKLKVISVDNIFTAIEKVLS